MPLTDLNHFLVLTRDIDASRNFYVNALGMEIANRPEAPFPGCWLSVNGRICVHLAQADDDPEMLKYFSRTNGSAGSGGGAIDHIAFFATDIEEFITRLTSASVGMRRRAIPSAGLEQIFVNDPDGVTIEINFPDYHSNHTGSST